MDIAVIGAGNRARKYLSCLPDGVRVSCLVEPDPLRLRQAAHRYGVPSSGCFSDAGDFFAAAPPVCAVIVAAPDRLHVPLSLASVQKGWHVLLEKPVALCSEDYMSLLEASRQAGVHVGVCLEMRFHPYFRRIKELIDMGAVGTIERIEHTEHIGPDRMAHTFVRGLWSRKDDSGPIFLSKCCHDADFLLWLTGRTPLEVRSRGALETFRSDSAAPARCIDCTRTGCPYSAVTLYRERGEWTDGFDVPEGSTLAAVIEEELRSGRYGRCVYNCDNDVFDTQDVEAKLTGGISLSMHLEGTSLREGRSTVIHGSAGTLSADNWQIIAPDIAEDWSHLAQLPLHAGADRLLTEDFFAAIGSGRAPLASLESAFQAHRLCWMAG